tara:strand:- start:26 stop:964 length:939 start_codon:yes stop_codon:yes gene_type:complete
MFGSEDNGAHRYIESFLKMCPKLNNNIIIPEDPISFLKSDSRRSIDTIVTGSSYGNGTIDKQLWRFALGNNINSIAIIEHWSWYIDRFIERDKLILPDKIIVNDRLAFDEAVNSGLPINKLQIIGNPHLEFLRGTPSSLKVGRKSLRDALAVPSETEIVLFLSERLEDDFGSSEISPLGYTEFEALNLLKRSLMPNQRLYIKPHPAEVTDKYFKYMQQEYILNDVILDDLFNFADHVVGMATMLLLELAIMGERVISLRPGARKPFVGEQYGLTIPAYDELSLSKAMQTREKKTIPKDFMAGSSVLLAKLLT